MTTLSFKLSLMGLCQMFAFGWSHCGSTTVGLEQTLPNATRSLIINILNKSKNALLQYFILCERVVLDKKYLLKLKIVSQSSCKRFVQTLFVSELCSVLCFKLYWQNFAFVQEKIVMLTSIGHNCVA